MAATAITMPAMGKKASKQQAADLHKGVQIPFRVDDPRLVDAIEAWAADHRRSRNMAIILLLEKALRDEGRWPPPARKDG